MSNVIETLSDVFALANNAAELAKTLIESTKGKNKKSDKDFAQIGSSGDCAKIGNRATSAYENYTKDTFVSFEEAIKMYRAITGACEAGTRHFVKSLNEVKKEYSIAEIIEITQGNYGAEEFKNFFERNGDVFIDFYGQLYDDSHYPQNLGFDNVSNGIVKKILAPVPTYDEYKAMQSKLADQRAELESARWYQTVQNEDISKLRGLLKECEAHLSLGEIGTSVTPVNILLTRINAALNESEEI